MLPVLKYTIETVVVELESRYINIKQRSYVEYCPIIKQEKSIVCKARLNTMKESVLRISSEIEFHASIQRLKKFWLLNLVLSMGLSRLFGS